MSTEFKAKLFQNAETLPSLACRRRYLDAMLVSRDLRSGGSAFAKRVAAEDAPRLVRERFALLKACMLYGDDAAVPYLYHLK